MRASPVRIYTKCWRKEEWNLWNRAADGQKYDSQFPALPGNPGLMDCWWMVDVVADEWRTERTRWEVNSFALTCEELHYTSITSLTHSPFPTGAASQYWAVTISSLPTGLESWFNHNPVQKYITLSTLAFNKSLQALWLQYKLQFDAISVNIFALLSDPKTCDHFKNTVPKRVDQWLYGEDKKQEHCWLNSIT